MRSFFLRIKNKPHNRRDNMKTFLYGFYTESAYLAFYEEAGETKKMEFPSEDEAYKYFHQE